MCEIAYCTLFGIGYIFQKKGIGRVTLYKDSHCTTSIIEVTVSHVQKFAHYSHQGFDEQMMS